MDTKTLLEQRLAQMPPERWGTLLGLLSMDVTAPFYERLGLDFIDRDRFVPLLRGLLVASCEQQVQRLEQPLTLVTDTLAAIEDAFGAAARARFLLWAGFVFRLPDDPPAELSAWQDVFERCSDSQQRWFSLGLPVALSEPARQAFLARCRLDEFRRLCQQTFTQPLSDWDLCLYALRKFSDEDDRTAADRVSAMLRTTVINQQQLEFWAWLQAELTPAEQQSVLKNAERLASADLNPSLMEACYG